MSPRTSNSFLSADGETLTVTAPLDQAGLVGVLDGVEEAKRSSVLRLRFELDVDKHGIILDEEDGTVLRVDVDLDEYLPAVKAVEFLPSYPLAGLYLRSKACKMLVVDQPTLNVDRLRFDMPLLKYAEFDQFRVVTAVDPAEFGASLSKSPKLETLKAYKLWDLGEQVMYLPSCRMINLTRAEGLSSLTLYAPRIKELVLESCYNLEQVHLLDEGLPEHVEFNLDTRKKRPSKFPVRLGSSFCMSSVGLKQDVVELAERLKSHPRVTSVSTEVDADKVLGAWPGGQPHLSN